MQVTCGAEWVTDKGNKRSYAVSLDETDLRTKVGDEKVDALDFNIKLKTLNQMADSYVIKYMVDEGAVTREWANKRIAEILGE